MLRVLLSWIFAVIFSLGGGVVWGALFRANLDFWPEIRWSAAFMCLTIVLLWRSLSPRLPLGLPVASTLPWAWVAVAATTACLLGLIVIGLRVGRFDADAFASSIDMRSLTIPMRVAGFATTALVAGFFEEVGFRGFLRHALIKRFGYATALVVPAVLFYAMHLAHGWARGETVNVLIIAAQIVGGGLLFGGLVQVTGSLVPSIVAHTLTDAVALPFEWTRRHNLTLATRRSRNRLGPCAHSFCGAECCRFQALPTWFAQDRECG
ncbi:MAG TPA: type II CAAX endopeptidase family protein [Polyangia bacterium]|jgi:membrane protease YdiL (CAAX protease family)|nr:type II CAAX endopeptidase family protein [Polyangia bacterium]